MCRIFDEQLLLNLGFTSIQNMFTNMYETDVYDLMDNGIKKMTGDLGHARNPHCGDALYKES